jgi:hypothetical protein
MLTAISVIMYTITGIFIYFDGYKISKNIIVSRYNKLKNLKELVSTRNKNMCMIFWICLSLIFKSLYINMCQKLNRSVIQIDKNSYEITYVISGHMYKIYVKPVRGPKPVILITDDNDEDITDIVVPYLGPHSNCHGNTHTPLFFKREKLIFELSNGNSLEFNINDTITLES